MSFGTLLSLAATHVPHRYPLSLVEQFTDVVAALLAVAVGVYAFVPLIIDLAINRSADADAAARRARRSGAAFDVLLGSIGLLGVSLCLGIAAVYIRVHALYVSEVAALCSGVLLLLTGTLALGLTLRAVRQG